MVDALEDNETDKMVDAFSTAAAARQKQNIVNSSMRLAASAIALLVHVFCAEAQSQEVRVDEIRKSIFFGGGSYYIDDAQIAELYQWLDSIPDLLEKYSIQLTSHTDPIGGKEYNEWLSQMRSEAVHQILLRKLIPEHKIVVKDWNYENAVYNTDSWAGRHLNRRVDVILYPVVF